MKKGSKLFLGVCLAIGLAIAFTGCVTKFDNRLMNQDIPITDHAVLYFDSEVSSASIDGDLVTSAESAAMYNKNVIVLLSPGTHSIYAQYRREKGNSQETSIESSKFMTVTNDFKAGHYYYMDAVTEGRNVSFRITDETDPTIWNDKRMQNNAKKRIETAKKKISGAVYPKQPALSLSYVKLINDAIEANPTPLEGNWIGREKKGMYFHGNYYRYYGYLDFKGVFLGDHEGTFEYTDSSIILTTLADFRPRFTMHDGMVNIIAKKTEYKYTLNGDQLVLILKDKPVDTFVRRAER